jgi:hypothetical protein
MPLYGYTLGDEAVRAFASLPVRQREKLLRVFDSLARFPSQQGDYQEAGGSGRLYEVKLSDDLMLTWWVDHAVREVRIVRIEPVE